MAGIARVYKHHDPTSFFRFVGEDANELPPSRVPNVFRQVAVCKRLDLEVFQTNEVEVAGETAGEFEVMIAPDARLLPPCAGERGDRLASSARADHFASKLPRELSDTLFCLTLRPRTGEELAGRKRSEVRDPEVNTNVPTDRW